MQNKKVDLLFCDKVKIVPAAAQPKFNFGTPMPFKAQPKFSFGTPMPSEAQKLKFSFPQKANAKVNENSTTSKSSQCQGDAKVKVNESSKKSKSSHCDAKVKVNENSKKKSSQRSSDEFNVIEKSKKSKSKVLSNCSSGEEKVNSKKPVVPSEELQWIPAGKPKSNITIERALNLIQEANVRTIKFIQERDEGIVTKEAFQIDRVPLHQENENYVPKSVLVQLKNLRALGTIQHIKFVENIYVHGHTLTNGEFKNQIWYHSRDVGVYPMQTIHKCSSDGLKMDDEVFAEPLLPQQVEPLDFFFIDALQMIDDLAPSCLDPNLLMSLLCGSPQGVNIEVKSFVHENYKIDDQTKEKILKLTCERQEKDEMSGFLTIEQIQQRFPVMYYVAPCGAVLHNSQAKINQMLGLKFKMRPINDDSALTPGGWSVNSQMSYEWMHKVQYTSIITLCEQLIDLESRLFELGFKSRHGRIVVAKDDVKSAYRIRFISKDDRFLSIFKVDDHGKKCFVVDHRQHFGSKASVTNYHRFAYAITKFESNVDFIRDFYPQLGLPKRKKYEGLTSRPPLALIQDDLDLQRTNPHGQWDPLIGIHIGGFLDDAMLMGLDVRDDITIPCTPCAKTGIRIPALKAHANLFSERFKVDRNLKKMLEDNGIDLNGLRLIILLGIAIHLDTFLMYLTAQYIASTVTYINFFLDNPGKAQPQKIWSTTSGKINCAMTVYYQLRGCMREFWTQTGILEWKHNTVKYLRPSKNILKNLQVIKDILLENKGRSIYNSKKARSQYVRGLSLSSKFKVHDLVGDASTSFGLGFANIRTGVFYSRALTDLEKELIKDIFILEAICTFLMFMVNRHHLANYKLNLWGDNEALVKSFHKCGTSCVFIDALMRIMMVELARFNIDPVGDRDKYEHNWCSTTEQIPFGDALSRNDIELFLNNFNANFPDITPKQLTNIGPIFSPQLRDAEELLRKTLVEHRVYLLKKKNRKKSNKK